MKIRFSPHAVENLVDIADYVARESPAAALRVRSAILDSVAVVARFPAIGRLQGVAGVRKFVARKYPY